MEAQPVLSDTRRNLHGYEDLASANKAAEDVQLEMQPIYPSPVVQPAPFGTRGGLQNPATPLSPMSLLPSSYESRGRRLVRIVLLVVEFVWIVVVLAEMMYKFTKYLDLDYSIISTLVTVRDTSITYTTVTKTQIMFFFYRSSLVNATNDTYGINVTQQYYIETVDLSARCSNGYEYYGTQSDAQRVDDHFSSVFVKITICLAALVVAICDVIKLLLGIYVRDGEIPMMLKLRLKSKFVFELSLYSLIDVVIVALIGTMIPLLDLDYDSNCLIAVVDYTVDGLYMSFNALMVCLICFIIPLFFFVIYTYLEDNMKYCCFALFWITLPAFLLVVASGHALAIITRRNTKDNTIFLVLTGNYIMLELTMMLTVIFAVLDAKDFANKKAVVEHREMRIVPIK